jgi:hypothetical protein
MDAFKVILDWAEVILHLLSGELPFFYNNIALIIWAGSILLSFLVGAITKKTAQNFTIWMLSVFVFSATADLVYRHCYNPNSDLTHFYNWISPWRGGQFMFLPLWVLTFLGAIYQILTLLNMQKKRRQIEADKFKQS